MKAKITPAQRQETWERAFGHLPKKKLDSEWYVHKSVCKYLREKHPNIRFYSTLDGFNLGNQRSLVSALQWFEPGVPDLFIYHNNGTHWMLVLELKKVGVKVGNDAHTKRQKGWLNYLASQGASAYFAIGYEEAIELIENHINPKINGKAKRK